MRTALRTFARKAEAERYLSLVEAQLAQGEWTDKLARWREVVVNLGLPGLRFHDLRHTGNTFAARSGVSTRDLMGRMGHDSMQAALIYQHATAEADARIIAALEAEIASVDGDRDDGGNEGEDDEGVDGTAGVLVPA